LDQPDRLERHAEPVGDELREHRLVALAVREGAGDNGHRAGRVEPDLHPLVADRGELDELGDGTSPQPAIAFAFCFARGKPIPVGERQRLLQDRAELARIVGVEQRRPVGHRLRRNKVAPTQIERIGRQFAGRLLDQRFD